MSNYAIEVEGLWKKYRLGETQPYVLLRDVLMNPFGKKGGKKDADEFWALRDINLKVKEGEVLGVIGRNGSGKSTLLKILSRITPPTKGEIRLRGRVASLLEVGTGFSPELTGRENVFLNGSILGMSREEIKRKFDEIVDFSGVEKFIDTPVKRYSSGMYVRLAFAVAAHLESEILIVDEVLAVGDAEFQKKCLGKMNSVARSGRTVLFVSHNMAAVNTLCARSVLIENGQVVFTGRTEDCVNQYSMRSREVDIDKKAKVGNGKDRLGTGAVRFAQVKVTDSMGKARGLFYSGDTIRFKTTLSVKQKTNGVAVIVVIRAGARKEQVTSVKHLLTDKMLAPGTVIEAVVDFPDNIFRPGEYPLYLSACEPGLMAENYDVLDDVIAPLVIEPKPKSSRIRGGSETTGGVFNIDSKLISVKVVA